VSVAAPLALRQRRSDFMERFVKDSHKEDERIENGVKRILGVEKR
jgi:hypothetical protein